MQLSKNETLHYTELNLSNTPDLGKQLAKYVNINAHMEPIEYLSVEKDLIGWLDKVVENNFNPDWLEWILGEIGDPKLFFYINLNNDNKTINIKIVYG